MSNSAIPLSPVLAQVNASVNYEGLATFYLRNEILILIKNRGVSSTMQDRVVSLCKHLQHYQKHQWMHDILLLSLALLRNKISIQLKGMMFTKKRLEEIWVSIISILDFTPSALLTFFVPRLFQVVDF